MFAESSKKHFTNYPLLFLAAAFAFGIALADFSHLSPKLALTFCLCLGISALRFRGATAGILLISAFVFAGTFSAGLSFEHSGGERLSALYDSGNIQSGDPVEVSGELAREPEQAPDGFFLFIDVDTVVYKERAISTKGVVRIFVPVHDEFQVQKFDELGLVSNCRLSAVLNLKREDSYLNPGSRKQSEIFLFQSIEAAGSVKSPLLLEKISDAQGFSPLGAVYRVRQRLISCFRDLFSPKTAGVLIASLLGNRHFLDKGTGELFREGGTFHVLVISGLHITFIGGILLLVVRAFTRNRSIQFLFTLTMLWSYSFSVGAELPVIRASLMFSILMFSALIFRRGNLPNSLGLSLLILLVWRPVDLFNPSFLLTAASVAAIVGVAFPLVEKLRSIGSWTPSAENPFPSHVPDSLRRLCETLYWREESWNLEKRQQIWNANLFKDPYFKNRFAKRFQNAAGWVFEGLVVSVIVQIVLLPLSVVHFHRISIFGFLLNLWVGAILALESFAALVAAGFAFFSDVLAVPFVHLTEFLNLLLTSIPHFLVRIDAASIRIPIYSGTFHVIYFLYFLPVVFLAALLNSWDPFRLKARDRHLLASFPNLGKPLIWGVSTILAAAVFVIVFHPLSEPRADGRLYVNYLDVGQGDSIFIVFPDGKTMLIDAGGRMEFDAINDDDLEGSTKQFIPDTPSIGEFVVSEYLWEQGYSTIDFIAATHADADHMQGLLDVAKNFHIENAWFGRMEPDDKLTNDLLYILARRDVKTLKVSRGDNFSIGGAVVEVLHPAPFDDLNASQNDNSIVLKIRYGSRIFLLTGDIERHAELLLSGTADLGADVVKAAHHGSKTSSTREFVERTKAAYVIIPVGKRSPFGHPNRDVVERWQISGAKVLATGNSGTVSFSTNGTDLKFETFVK